ncbi:hypothetical protein PR202_ga27496 [Eleusine coracana subsp. coracana]|uniref:Uncharacterized protein n=1 Tax=Eleusine coracana subsp. coracana TaxID=191504 RepID=A0AAV5DG90_ELECO|nr:hypothetical protein PR202_ga27496 [Eleusine coracana subsp. coracana]
MKDTIHAGLDIQSEVLAEKYLGLPTAVGRSTKETFEYIHSRLKGVIGSWSGWEASSAGRDSSQICSTSCPDVLHELLFTACGYM